MVSTAGIEKGPTFRRVAANGRVGEDALTERAVWKFVHEYAAQVGSGELRRTICVARQRSYAGRRAASWSKFSLCWGTNRS
ncbi:MAG: hypothetical protein ABSD75_26055 [Terriglobales bacterium]